MCGPRRPMGVRQQSLLPLLQRPLSHSQLPPRGHPPLPHPPPLQHCSGEAASGEPVPMFAASSILAQHCQSTQSLVVCCCHCGRCGLSRDASCTPIHTPVVSQFLPTSASSALPRTQVQLQQDCSLDFNDEPTMTLCSLSMLTRPTQEVGPSL